MVRYLYLQERKKHSERIAPKVIGKFKENKVRRVYKRPKLIGKINTRNIKRPILILNNDKRERYFNPITFNYVLRPTYLAALRKIKKKDEELQRKFEEVSQTIEKKILCFPLRKALKNYTKSFGIKIIHNSDPLIQLSNTTESITLLLEGQLI